MMIHIREEDRVVFLTGRKTYAEAMGRQLIFFRHQGKWLLRVPYDIRAESPVMIEHGQSVILRENHGQNVVHLDVSRYSEGYGSFRKYVPEGSVEIGNRIDCDVYVQDRNAASCTICFKERTAEITDAEGNTTVLNIGDRFRTVNLCLVYHPLFLMINAPANIYVSLPAYSGEIRTAPLPAQQCPVYDSGFRSVNLSDEFTVVLEEPEKVQEYRRNPLLFTMGPALTMSSAALCAGLISVYRGWLNGRSVMDLLPMVMLPGVMVISTLIWTPAQRIYDAITNQRRRTSRDNSYRKYLEHRTEEIECFKKMYDQRIRECFPEPLEIRTKQILRMPFHDDFLCVRYGEGEHRLHINFDMRFHLDREDPLYLPLNTLLHSDTMSTVGFLSLKECRNITVQEETVFWWILSQLCLLHAPDALKTVFLAPSSWFNEHRWICRIPHVYCGRAGSGIRLFAADEADLHMIVDELNEHGCEQVLFVIGNELTVRTGFPGCIIHCGCTMIPPDSEHILYTDRMLNSDGSFSFYEADGITEEEACSMLSVLSLQQSDSERFRYLSSGPSFFELYGLTHASEFAIEHRWDNNMVRDSISALIGIRDDGREMILNLHEHGNGPHGLIAGMTGSGKSELLITLILSLAVSYSPRELQFVMIDFKGGGAVSALTPNGLVLPHICGILTDLDDLIVDRALVSFQNECRRRESLFVQMSDMTEEAITDIHSYQQKWQSDYGIPYLPELIIIVDEFAELKKNYPGFMKDLITLARVGRSLGIHLILATQKPAGIVDEQIWSNSRFKLCLRVQDKQDSSEVLHDPCASRLRQPGSFYFLCDGLLERGYAGYTGSSAEQGICSVSLLNLQAQVERSARNRSEHHETQLHALLKEIHQAAEQYVYEADSLWLDPIEELEESDIRINEMMYGIADDYYHSQRTEMYLKEGRPLYIVSLDREEKYSLLHVFLKGIMQHSFDSAVIINDNFPELHDFCADRMISGHFSSERTERVRWLEDDLRSGKCGRTILIITDVSAFLDSSPDHAGYLGYWLENSEMLKLTLIVFASAAQSVPYRLLSLFRDRISLRNENLQDLSLLFERNVTDTVKDNRHGLMKLDRVLHFCWPEIRPYTFSMKSMSGYHVMKIPEPYLPDYAIVGMRLRDHQDIPADERMLIVSDNEEMIDLYDKRLRSAGFNVRILRSETDVEGIRGPLICTEARFRHNPSFYSGTVLYCGSQYRSYYMFPALRENIPDHCGVLVSAGRAEVIYLVNER